MGENDFHINMMREIAENIQKGIAKIEDLRYAFGRLQAAERTARKLADILRNELSTGYPQPKKSQKKLSTGYPQAVEKPANRQVSEKTGEVVLDALKEGTTFEHVRALDNVFIPLKGDCKGGEKQNGQPKEEPQHVRLATLLANFILQNNPKHTRLKIDFNACVNLWSGPIEKLMRINKVPEEQVEKVINFCQRDPFWQTNILSGIKLRENFDQLVAKMNRIEGGNKEKDMAKFKGPIEQLTTELKNKGNRSLPPGIKDETRKLFYHIGIHWHILQRRVGVEGEDIKAIIAEADKRRANTDSTIPGAPFLTKPQQPKQDDFKAAASGEREEENGD